MLYTAAPSTWPTGEKPTALIAANSSELSADPQVPLARISCIRASATGGNSLLTPLAYSLATKSISPGHPTLHCGAVPFPAPEPLPHESQTVPAGPCLG